MIVQQGAHNQRKDHLELTVMFPGTAVRRIRWSFDLLKAVSCVLWCLGCGLSVEVHAQATAAVAEIVMVAGKVEVLSAESSTWEPASAPRFLYAGDQVRTDRDGTAHILTDDGSRIQVNRNSRFVLKNVGRTAGWFKTTLTQLGSLYQLFAWKPRQSAEISIGNDNRDKNIELETSTVKAGIRGTWLTLRVVPETKGDTSILRVLDGVVDATALTGPGDSVIATAGYQVMARANQPLKLERLTITPQNAVQWTLYVPPLLTEADIPFAREDPGLAKKIGAAYETVLSGALIEARDQLRQLSRRYPQESPPLQMLAVVLLSLNDNEPALVAARGAVSRAPNSAAAAIVSSYVYQSLFDLEQARKETKRALELDPDNVLALTNLARLQFGADEVDAAWTTLQRAGEVDPENAEAYNLRGFVLLARNETDAAINEFERAVDRDRRLGEPHLGLGLAHMRLGETEAAFRAIAKAVLLDPQRSLFMSYWGKMLYQTRSFDKALEVLERAQALDPRDPTPELYKAVILRDLNRSGEAIRSFNKAVALNDNRAVYRSRFLLDQDLASRNVDLSILYSQLGLNAWAKNKAIASIKQDYTNANAHLFYAGSLFELEGRSYSFNSEALLARLLQPANVNTFNNFNNYTALFEKPAAEGTLEARAGNQGTYGGNAELFGAVPAKDFAFQIGGFYDRTDGWREINFDRSKSVAAIGKWQPTPSDGVFFGASRTDQEQGDTLFPRFEVDSPPRPDDRSEAEVTRLELGYHRHLSPASDLLVYLTHLSTKIGQFQNDLFDVTENSTIDLERSVDADRPFLQGQVHYTFEVDKHRLRLGSLQYRGDFDGEAVSEFVLRGDGQTRRLPFESASGSEDVQFASYYVGDTWRARDWLIVEAAAYYDRMRNANPFQGTAWTVEGFNPRLGLITRPTARDTLRLAAFRYVLPFISPRLDPTDVAGIPVFRNTLEGSENTEYALAWEHEWRNGFASLDLFYLDSEFMDRQRSDDGQETKRTLNGRTSGAELAVNYLLTDRIGLSGTYRYLNVDKDVERRSEPKREDLSKLQNVNRDDHLFKLGLRYQRPDGISAGIAQTYRYIDNHNVRSSDVAFITDVDLRYEFPGRRGAAKLEVFNLFDSKFNWVTDPFVFEGRAPARQVLFTLSFNY